MSFASRAASFARSCSTGLPGEYRICREGLVSLYASCFAALARHSVGDLDDVSPGDRAAWCDYINSWQDPETGCFVGPEVVPDECTRSEMDEAYVRLHLAAHVLPVLEILGGTPAYPLRFARRFADAKALRDWLEARDWRQAWLEGNNLLFAGQLLVHLREHEREPSAQSALDLYFDWLDAHQDPTTGLWGTNGYCDLNDALYGGYHQLLVYLYCGRPVHYAERIVDAVLSLQNADGSFSRAPGGGACEDIDAVHVLVNLVQRTGYRLADARSALSRTVPHILSQQALDGGFVYRWGRSYMQSGLLRTFVPANTSDLFSTWFRLHTLAVIAGVLALPALGQVHWRFSGSCSMGWHRTEVRPSLIGALGADLAGAPAPDTGRSSAPSAAPHPAARAQRHRSLGGRALVKAVRALPPRQALWLVGGLDSIRGRLGVRWPDPGRPDGDLLDRLGREVSFEVVGGLEPRHWRALTYRAVLRLLASDRRLVHLGSGRGSLSYTLATQGGLEVTATDGDPRHVEAARLHFHHARLTFVPSTLLPGDVEQPQVVVLTDLVDGQPAWERWAPCWSAWSGIPVVVQLTAPPSTWRDAARSPISPRFALSKLIPDNWSIDAIDQEAGAAFARLTAPPGPDRALNG